MSSTAGKKIIKPLIGFGLVIDLIIIDQITKWLILELYFKPRLNLEPLPIFDWLTSTEKLPFISENITPFFNLTMVWNHGISFGLFQSGNPWPLIIMASVIVTIFSIWLCRTKSWVEVMALSLVIGGAIGNIIDRLHFGAVADFFDFFIGNWHYPAFNMADSFISIGVVILVVNSLFFQRNNEKGE